MRNLGTCRFDEGQLYFLQRSGGCRREKLKQRTCEGERTEAKHRDGLIGSSEEVSVKDMERSDQIIQRIEFIN